MDESTPKGGKRVRRVPISNVVPLRVSNRRDSLGIESFSSVAPPCYTSQREAASSVATHDPQDSDGSEFDEDDDGGSVSVRSCPELGQDYVLPSPYSTEDLLQGYTAAHLTRDHTHPAAPSSTHTQSCTHGYTHTHSQCTLDITSGESYVVSQHTPTAVRSSGAFPVVATRPYSHHLHRGTTSKSYRSTSPYVSSRVLPAAEGFTSPRPTLYHHHPKSSPSAVGHLTHQRRKVDYVYQHKSQDGTGGDAEDISRPPASMDSNMTCLPEDTAAHHRLHEFDAERNRFAEDAPEMQRSSHASNFVSLSRKSTFKKPAFFQQVASSSITGKFTIDPSLRIPSSLLKAIKPLSLTGMNNMFRTSTDPPGIPLKRLAKAPLISPAKTHRKNLVLEVENGGINVDVYLVPLAKRTAMNSDSDPPPVDNDQANAGTPPDFYSEERQSHRRPGACLLSTKRLPPLPSPTLLDLRLREVKIRPVRGSSRPKRGREFPLMARILAPNPRPPFHLFASTIVAPSSNSEPTIEEESDQTPSPSAVSTQQPERIGKNRTRPLTIHVAAGDLDDHIHLSRELAETAMVLAESAFSRGYFIGQLVSSWGERGAANTSTGDDWVLVDDGGRSPNGMSREAFNQNGRKSHIQRDLSEGEAEAMPGYSDAGLAGGIPDKHEEEEWSGDKVDVVVGNGKVHLQFLDEEDPFGKDAGFWHKLGLGCR
ncbi:hypothetical protein M413DRAFT_30476 [Hebeloma cylindrosporum]|uniref:Uncharacterized protein n=1 Tax=Hebeloma cylindrosporum TaxID=76867 RepID=A0A0C2XJZ8_HEBCY|nr:hypothetical protein M413DRAFT_30476 [Hebeloma cylindrosporum h7]